MNYLSLVPFTDVFPDASTSLPFSVLRWLAAANPTKEVTPE